MYKIILKFLFTIIIISTYAFSYSQSANRLLLDEHAVIIVEDNLGSIDSVVIGIGLVVRNNQSYPASTRIDYLIPQEINYADSMHKNPDVRVIHKTTPICNAAMNNGNFPIGRNYTFNQASELKYDIRGSDYYSSDWTYTYFQPFNLKIQSSHFPIYIKARNYVFLSDFQLGYAFTDTLCNIYRYDGSFSGSQNPFESFVYLDTINNLSELRNKVFGFSYCAIHTETKKKLLDDINIYKRNTSEIVINNPKEVTGSVTILNLLGQKILENSLLPQKQSFTLPSQPVIIVIQTPNQTWKHVY